MDEAIKGIEFDYLGICHDIIQRNIVDCLG